MRILFFFKGLVSVDQKTKSYVEKRLAALDRVIHKILHVDVVIEKDKKGFFRVEATVHVPGQRYYAEETTRSIEASADIVQDELKRQGRKDRERWQTLRKRGARSIKKKIVIDKAARF